MNLEALARELRQAQKAYFAAPRHTEKQKTALDEMRKAEGKMRDYLNDNMGKDIDKTLAQLVIDMMQAHAAWIRSQTREAQWAARSKEKAVDDYLGKIDEQDKPKIIQTTLF